MAKDKYSTLSVRISAEEKEKLMKYCEENDVSISQVLRKAIRDLIKE